MNSQLIIEYLNKLFPDAKAELDYKNDFELLVAVVLSAQTTDIAVNKVTKELFRKYPTPKDMKDAEVSDLEQIIKTIGLYKTKAKNIKSLATDLYEKYDSKVPDQRNQLEALSGVGRKTANVVLSNAFNIPAFAVDTHVTRVSIRLGIAEEKDNVLKIEEKLMDYFPKETWLKLHHQFIFFGRYHCTARKPKCQICELSKVCPFFQKQIASKLE